MEEKGGKRTLERRDRGERESRRKNSLVIGWGRRSPTRDPKPSWPNNSTLNWRHPRGPVASAQTRKPNYDLTHHPRLQLENPHLEPRPLHTCCPLVVPCGTSAALHPLGSSGLIDSDSSFSAPTAYSARETCFRPVWHHSDPPGLDFHPV